MALTSSAWKELRKLVSFESIGIIKTINVATNFLEMQILQHSEKFASNLIRLYVTNVIHKKLLWEYDYLSLFYH